MPIVHGRDNATCTSVDIAATAMKHQEVIPYLLAAHGLSGCDSVAYMYGIGKAIVFKVLHNGYVLKTIGDLQLNFADVLEEATAFVAACYGCKEDGQMSGIR